MRNGPRLDVWVVALLVSVCLMGAGDLLLRFNIGGLKDIPAETSTAPSPAATALPPLQTPHAARVPHRKASKSESRPAPENSAHLTRSSGNPNSESVPSPQVGRMQASAPQDAERKTLKSLGYVQKSNGVIEAIIHEGDGVQVVHVGDAYEDKYTLAQISPEGVEIVAKASSAPGSSDRQTVLAASSSNPPRRVGYVARSNGSRLEVVAEDNSVSLVQAGGNPTASASNRIPEPSLETAGTLSLHGPIPNQVANNSKRENAKRGLVPINHEPARTFKEGFPDRDFDQNASPLAAALNSSLEGNAPNQPPVPSEPIGFVEKADGKVQAIVAEGDEVRLTVVPKDQVETMIASLRTSGADTTSDGEAAQPKRTDQIAGLPYSNTSASGLARESAQRSGLGPFELGKVFQGREETSMAGPQPSGQTDKPPPPPEAVIADDKAAPEKPPPDEAAITASFGEETDDRESAKREDAVLESLGILDAQRGRASPEAASYAPAAPSTGPPEAGANVPSSFGFEDWHYGRASPLPADSGIKAGVTDSSGRQPPVLNPIGFIEWQDGRTEAVVKDGHGGVRLVSAGETFGGRFRVAIVGPDEVELESLPSWEITLAESSLGVGPGNQSDSTSMDARPAAAPIAILPIARTSSALALALEEMPKPGHATKSRPRNRKAAPQKPSASLRPPHAPQVSQVRTLLEGMPGVQRTEAANNTSPNHPPDLSETGAKRDRKAASGRF